ncbi:MAG: haloacid dehalogenase type II [Steroidobacteraceae bacterium]
MELQRREFLEMAAGLAVTGSLGSALEAQAAPQPRFKAIAFDAFPIFDPRPVFRLAETLFPGKGEALGNAWRTRQFEYQWLRALSGHYADFTTTTESALVFAAKSLRLELTRDKRVQLMQAYLELKAWPEVPSALGALKEAGLRLAFLSNMTRAMLNSCINSAGLNGVFDHVLSTDQIRTYKPDPRAYQMAVDAFRLPRDEIVFAAFAGWDACGAKWYGYPTFWVNRLSVPLEELAVTPDAVGKDLTALVSFAGTSIRA